LLKPWVYVVGSQFEATYIRVNGGAGSVQLDSVAFTAQASARFGLINCYLGHGTSLNLDLYSVGPNTGTPSALITLQSVFVAGSTNLTGRAPNIDYLEMYDVYFDGGFSMDGLEFGPAQGLTFANGATFTCNHANINGQINNSLFQGAVSVSNSVSNTCEIDFSACGISSTLTTSGSNVLIKTDSVSMPVAANQTIGIGTTFAYTSDTSHSGYTPKTPANWSGPAPTTVQQAIDRMAAVVSTNGSVPIP
jgi:hypothetical protein